MDIKSQNFKTLFLTTFFGLGIYIFFCAPFVYANFTFAPPRTEEPQKQTSEIDKNASTQLSVISSLEKKIKTSISPAIISYFHSLDDSRLGFAKKFQSLSSQSKPQTALYYLYTTLSFIFSHTYIAYGLLVGALLFLIRIILLRFNFKV